MIHHDFNDLPREIGVAVSGGVDSMAALDFVKNSGRTITAYFFDHGTETSKEAWYVVQAYCMRRDIDIVKGTINESRHPDRSLEEHWRIERYSFLHKFAPLPIVTAHTLDDCVETWIFSSLHGQGKIIPRTYGNVVRPFRLTRKTEFINWCRKRNIEWHEDYSNEDVRYMRNFIRHELLPKALVVNPGIHKVIAKKVRADHD